MTSKLGNEKVVCNYTIKSNLRQYHNIFVEKLKSETNIGIIFSKCGGFEVCPDLEKIFLTKVFTTYQDHHLSSQLENGFKIYRGGGFMFSGHNNAPCSAITR